MTLWTVGHGTRSMEGLVALLQSAGIVQLADVRTIPRSRFNPQFNRESLAEALPGARILYLHVPGLGGLRRPRPGSTSSPRGNDGLRGYADHMLTAAFRSSLDSLLEVAARGRTVVMCAEREPGRCHRSLLADAVVARGVAVVHLIEPDRVEPHVLTEGARVDEQGQVNYPGPAVTIDMFAADPEGGGDGRGGRI